MNALKKNQWLTGLGFRQEFDDALNTQDHAIDSIQFVEVAPENWMGIGGKRRRLFDALARRFPIICHGLSLSLGGPAPLNKVFLKQLKQFFSTYNITLYSEHLAYCTDSGQLYDLLPMPFTEEAVFYLSDRIRQVQTVLEQTIALENISYYYRPSNELSEIEFINAVLNESGCALLLDVNNLYVNSVNHGYCPYQFLKQLQAKQIAYMHIAGHYQTGNECIDTHGETICEPVWKLLQASYKQLGVLPTLLERDNNIPALTNLLQEVERIKTTQATATRELCLN